MNRNLATVRRTLDAISVGDLEGVRACFAEDIVFDGSRIAEATYRGRESYMGFLAESRRTVPYRFSEYTLLDDGDTVVAIVDIEVTGSTSGAALGGRMGFLYRMRDGLIAEQVIHPDVEALVDSLGFSHAEGVD